MNPALLYMERIPATLLVILAVISINLGSALAISLFPVYGTVGMLFLRMMIGGIFLSVIYRKMLVKAAKQAPLGILLLGVVITLQSGAFYESLARIPLGIAVSIEFLGPLGVALATSRRFSDVFWVLLAAAGIFLLTPDVGTRLDLHGVLYACGAGAGWAGVILISRHLGKTLEGGVGMALGMAVCGMLVFPFAGVQALQDIAMHPETLIVIAGVALFSAAIPYLFEFLALKTMPAKKFGVLVALEPVVAAIVGAVALSQIIDLSGWGAILLISVASIGVAVFAKQEDENST